MTTLQQHQLTMTDPADIQAKARRKLQLTRELGKKSSRFSGMALKGDIGRGLPQWITGPSLQSNHLLMDKRDTPPEDYCLLVLCIVIHPQALVDEMVMFIYSKGGELYSWQLITNQSQELVDVTQKKVSIEAYKAYSPANMTREYLFWHHCLPLGVVDIPRKHLVDVNEFTMEAKRLDRSKAWGISF
eukprot:jgi/Psemu1/49682/gm1.49682_g